MFGFLKRKKNSESLNNKKKESFSSDYSNVDMKEDYDMKENYEMKEVVYFSTDKQCYTKTFIPERLRVIQKPVKNVYNNSFEEKRNSFILLHEILDLYIDMVNDDNNFDNTEQKTSSVYSQIRM
jgi:hypothetical protein